MVTAVDTSVLLDVLLNDPQHASASMTALRRAAGEGSLILCEIALAELTPALPPADLPRFLSDWNLTFVPSSQSSAILAGEMFRTYCDEAANADELFPTFFLPPTPRPMPNDCWPGTVVTIEITSRNCNFGSLQPAREDDEVGGPSPNIFG
jgi:hypothetical protein